MISRSQWITNEQRFNWARNQGQSKSADCQLRLWMMKGPDMQMVCITLRDDCFQLMVSVIATVDRISSRLQRIVTKIVSLPGIFTNWTDRTRFIRCVTHYHQELNQHNIQQSEVVHSDFIQTPCWSGEFWAFFKEFILPLGQLLLGSHEQVMFSNSLLNPDGHDFAWQTSQNLRIGTNKLEIFQKSEILEKHHGPDFAR